MTDHLMVTTEGFLMTLTDKPNARYPPRRQAVATAYPPSLSLSWLDPLKVVIQIHTWSDPSYDQLREAGAYL